MYVKQTLEKWPRFRKRKLLKTNVQASHVATLRQAE